MSRPDQTPRPTLKLALLAAVAGLAAFGFSILLEPVSAAPGDVPVSRTWAPAQAAPHGQGEDCAACHSEVVDEFARNPHASLDASRWSAAGQGSCSACHGPAEAHLDAGGGVENIRSFGPGTPAKARQDACMTCHSESHPRFKLSHHAKANMDCTSCHSVHATSGERASGMSGSDSCKSCHTQAFAQFQFTQHHRISEGTMECTSCHNPHEPSTRVRLGGFKQDQCASCHTDKHGPYIFEHGAQRIEGCTACHEPHGSPNRHMLKFQSQADLCYSCHNNIPGFHNRFVPPSAGTFGTQCTNCHSAIHGSNIQPAFLR